MKRNFILLLLIIIFSGIFAYPVGYFFDRIFFVQGSGTAFDVGPGKLLPEILMGLFFSYLFILPLLFIGWRATRKWIWIIVCAFPVLLLFLSVGQGFIVFPSAFFVIGIALGFVTEWLKSRHSLPEG